MCASWRGSVYRVHASVAFYTLVQVPVPSSCGLGLCSERVRASDMFSKRLRSCMLNLQGRARPEEKGSQRPANELRKTIQVQTNRTARSASMRHRTSRLRATMVCATRSILAQRLLS